MQDRQQTRQQIQATSQQQLQYRSCVQSAEQLRTRLRQMKQLQKGDAISPEQAAQWREQVRTQLRQMQQEHERLMTGLSDEQQAGLQEPVKNANRAAQDLDTFSEALGFELEQAKLDTEKVRLQAQRMETSVAQLEKQYRAMGDELGIQAGKEE